MEIQQGEQNVNELTKLKGLIEKTLYNQGILGKIRAQLRQAVYTTIQKDEVTQDPIGKILGESRCIIVCASSCNPKGGKRYFFSKNQYN